MNIDFPKSLRKNIKINADREHTTIEDYIIKTLKNNTIPAEYIKSEIVQKGLPILVNFISTIPGVTIISSNKTYDHKWWIKLNIDLTHSLAWTVIQYLEFIFNYISLTEKLPTVFMPVSPPPHLNGGPKESLSWVIESRIAYLDPNILVKF